jgi:hypothetical protein
MIDKIKKFTLNENLPELVEASLAVETELREKFEPGFGGDTPLLTQFFDLYNLFAYESMQGLEQQICQKFRKIEPTGVYHLHGWLNVFSQEHPYLGLHKHGSEGQGAYHGIFIVDSPTENYTHFLFDDGTEEKVFSENNLLFFANQGDSAHKTSAVAGENKRITIAFDILPDSMFNDDVYQSEHFKFFTQVPV